MAKLTRPDFIGLAGIQCHHSTKDSLLEAQEVKSPRGQIHIQARQVHLISIALEFRVVERICQLPRSPCQVVPGQVNLRLRLVLREVNDDQVTRLALAPAPGHQVQVAAVVGPTRALA